MDYKIRLDAFQGPLDLLLNLIEKAKIDIYDIPINIITDQYIEYLYAMEKLNLDIASDFILMAATLIEIKSKMLLPEEDKDDECEDAIDPREELVFKLLEYKKYKEVANKLRDSEKNELKVYYKPREDLSIFEEEELDLETLDLNLILKSINKIIKRRGIEEEEISIESIQKDEYSIKECCSNIILKLDNSTQFKFTDLLNEKSTRSEIVAYFLSLLELIKSKLIVVRQEDNFMDLIIIKREIGEYK